MLIWVAHELSSYKVGFPIWDVAGSAAVSWPSLGGTARVCNSLIILLLSIVTSFLDICPYATRVGCWWKMRTAQRCIHNPWCFDLESWWKNWPGERPLCQEVFCMFLQLHRYKCYLCDMSILSEDDVLSLIIFFRWSGFGAVLISMGNDFHAAEAKVWSILWSTPLCWKALQSQNALTKFLQFIRLVRSELFGTAGNNSVQNFKT